MKLQAIRRQTGGSALLAQPQSLLSLGDAILPPQLNQRPTHVAEHPNQRRQLRIGRVHADFHVLHQARPPRLGQPALKTLSAKPRRADGVPGLAAADEARPVRAAHNAAHHLVNYTNFHSAPPYRLRRGGWYGQPPASANGAGSDPARAIIQRFWKGNTMIIDKKAEAARKAFELAAYRRLAEKLPTRMLQRDARQLAGPEPELALIAREILAARGAPLEEPPRTPDPIDAGFHFRPSETIDGRTAIDLWWGNELAATIYVGRGGLHVVCATGFAPGALAVEVQLPYGVQVAIERGRL